MDRGPSASFGDLLRRYRTAAGLTQEELAERAGVSARGIGDLERGVSQAPHKDTVQLLAGTLGLTGDARAAFAASARRRAVLAPHSTSPSVPPPIRNNLPIEVTSFVGREQELEAVGALLWTTHLLTLTGTGGCGKTRLALKLGDMVLDDFADGVWLVELAPLADPSLVSQAVAAVIGVREIPDRDLASVLIDALRPRQLLLIVDNCEHLIAACAQLVDAFLRGCPRVRVLATSREALGIAGEVSHRIPSLQVPADQPIPLDHLIQTEAVRLFVERARVVQPAFSVTEHNASAVTQICRRLDGIPLAIELGAARLRAFSAEQIASRLDQRFRLLTSGSRAALPRQQTLAALVAWS